MTFAEYVALDAANFSTIKEFGHSAAHYLHRLQVERKDNATLMRGRAAHITTLEPEKFEAGYAIWTGARRQGKAWDEFEAQAEADGRSVLKTDEAQRALDIASAVRSDPVATKYLAKGRAEQTILWTDAETGIACKARIDFASESMHALCDLKTGRDASPDGFGRAVWRFQYHVQAAFYVDGWAASHGGEVLPFVFIAVESEAPFVVQCYRVPEHVIEMGRETYRGWLQALKQHRESGSWPGYSEGTELELVLPRWAGFDDGENDATALGLDWGEAIAALDATGT
jgi:hypothetical protein